MSKSDSLTTRQVGEVFGEPEWRIRRIVDSLRDIPRFGGKRMIPRERLTEVAAALARKEGSK